MTIDIHSNEKEQSITGFTYNVNLIGATVDQDKEFADPENTEKIWPEGLIRVNHVRWINSALGINDPDRMLQVETFDGKQIACAFDESIRFFTFL